VRRQQLDGLVGWRSELHANMPVVKQTSSCSSHTCPVKAPIDNTSSAAPPGGSCRGVLQIWPPCLVSLCARVGGAGISASVSYGTILYVLHSKYRSVGPALATVPCGMRRQPVGRSRAGPAVSRLPYGRRGPDRTARPPAVTSGTWGSIVAGHPTVRGRPEARAVPYSGW
jgi:hypothetical protein